MKDEFDKRTNDLFEKEELLSKDMQIAISKFIKQLVKDQISTALNERELTFSKFSIEKLKELLLDYDSGNLVTGENFADEIYAHDIVTSDNFYDTLLDNDGATKNDLSESIEKYLTTYELQFIIPKLVRKETKQ
tara:strand:- start:334 stop:735 length:402 start_codon:yes stop_codon:yes gene_type:complete